MVTSDQQKPISLEQIDRMFLDSSIYDAPPEQLRECLHCLSTTQIENDMVRHCAIIKGLTINHVQTAQVIRDLNKQNSRIQFLFVILAIVTIGLTIIGLFDRII